MSSSDEIAGKIDSLWQTFLPTMLSRLSAIEAAIDSIEKGQPDEDARGKAAQEAHKLAGSLGTFGLASSSVASSQIENLLYQSGLTPASTAELRNLFQSLKRDIESR